MDKSIAVPLFIVFLLLGVVVGYVIPKEVETREIVKEVFVDVPVEVEKLVADSSLYLSLAVDDFMEYVDDEELFECNEYEYNLDEISVVRVYDSWNLDFDDEDYKVQFDVKLEYDEDNERSCKKVFEVEAKYKVDKDVKIFVD